MVKSVGPLVSKEGNVLVSKRKFPRLHAALERGAAKLRKDRADWARVAELRAKGEGDKADRLAKRLIGVVGEPMSEETKERLRQYREEHADEIKERARSLRVVRRRTGELMKAKSRKRKRRGR